MRYFVGQGEDLVLDDQTRRALRGSFIELSQGVTHYELTGPANGEVVVLTGGLTVPLFYWDGLVQRLHSRGLRTLAFSAYGRGYSARLTTDYQPAVFVEQVSDLVQALGVASHHVVGTSMGALVAMEYVVGAAEVKTLTLAGPAGLSEPPANRWLFKSDRAAALVGRRLGRRLLESHLSHNVNDAAIAEALASMVRDAFRYRGSMYALFSTLQHFPLHGRTELFRMAGQAGIPTLLVWGEDDRVTPLSGFDQAQALLQPHEGHVIAACGHMAPFERPSEVARLIASFATNPSRTA